MECCSLHPLDLTVVRSYVAEYMVSDRRPLNGNRPSSNIGHAGERGLNVMTLGLAVRLAEFLPSFVDQGLSLTGLEARVDRGIGMLMRPPSRLFSDAGMSEAEARQLPIRLDLSGGMMGGAYIPARLMPELDRILNERLERLARRFHDADMDAYSALDMLLRATSYARQGGYGLFEALDAVDPDRFAPRSAGGIVTADPKTMDPATRARIAAALKAPKKISLLGRILRRSTLQPSEFDSRRFNG